MDQIHITAHQFGERRFGAVFSVRRAARPDIAAKAMGYFELEFFSINFWSAACCSGVVA